VVLAAVSDRRERQVPPLAEVARKLEQQIRVRKQRLLLQRAVEQMQRAHDFRLEPDAAQALFSRAQGTRRTPVSRTSWSCWRAIAPKRAGSGT
jgi:hypothetical protein